MLLSINGKRLKHILWLQWTAGIGAMMMLFTLGLTVGWTSPYLVHLTSENSLLQITTDEASWVASLLNLGRFLGAVIGGISVGYFDSKRTLVFIGFPLMFGWISIIVANSVVWLYVARIATGISGGMAFCSFPIYLGEISSPRIRGALVTLAMTGVPFGTLIGNIMGSYISMSLFAYIALVPTIAFTLLFLWIPQSPHYLVRVGRMEDAKESIVRFNPNVNWQVELDSLKNFITTTESLTFGDRLREFNLPQNRKAGFITLGLYFFMQFSGLNSVVFYQELILTAAKVNIISPATMVATSSAAGVVSGWVLTYVADKFERKVLMISSSIGVGISMGAFGIHFTLLAKGFDPDPLQWLPIAGILIFIIFVSTGIAAVPNIILSEFFAPNIKKLAACFASIAVGVFAFASASTYLPLVDVTGEAPYFWGQMSLMVLSVIFAAIFLPKTRGKSLQEIQDSLAKK